METVLIIIGAYYLIATIITVKWMLEAPALPEDTEE
jgi:hypothetical protein